jgi:hypothetical protein
MDKHATDEAMGDLILAATNRQIEAVSSGEYSLPNDTVDVTMTDIFSDEDEVFPSAAAMLPDEQSEPMDKKRLTTRVVAHIDESGSSPKHDLLAASIKAFPVLFGRGEEWSSRDGVRTKDDAGDAVYEAFAKMIAHLVVAMDAATVEAGSCSGFRECAKVRSQLKSIYAGFKAEKSRSKHVSKLGVREYAEAFPDRMPRFFVGMYYQRLHALTRYVKKAMAAIAWFTMTSASGKAKNMAKIREAERLAAARLAVENNIKLRVGVPVVKFTESGNRFAHDSPMLPPLSDGEHLVAPAPSASRSEGEQKRPLKEHPYVIATRDKVVTDLIMAVTDHPIVRAVSASDTEDESIFSDDDDEVVIAGSDAVPERATEHDVPDFYATGAAITGDSEEADMDMTVFPGADSQLSDYSDPEDRRFRTATGTLFDTRDDELYRTARAGSTGLLRQIMRRIQLEENEEYLQSLPQLERLAQTPASAFPIMYVDSADWARTDAVNDAIARMATHMRRHLLDARARLQACRGDEECGEVRRFLKLVYAGFKAEKRRSKAAASNDFGKLAYDPFSLITKAYVGQYYDSLHEATPTYKKVILRLLRLTKMSPEEKAGIVWADEGDDAEGGGRSQPGVSVVVGLAFVAAMSLFGAM